MCTKPTGKPVPAAADVWVESRSNDDAPQAMKRLTIDVPASLHRAIKTQCVLRGTTIADEVRELLLQKYGNPSKRVRVFQSIKQGGRDEASEHIASSGQRGR